MIPAKTLDQIRPGHRGQILAVGGDGALRARLLDMGLLPETPVTVTGAAPAGDPIRLRLRGYELTLRRCDAAQIHVREESRL